jgi:hypothetical protein
MTNDQDFQPARRVGFRNLSSAEVFGAGAALALTGVLLSGSAVVAAIRRRVRQMEVPPREVARQKWSQTRAATSAGVDAWRKDAKTFHGR